MLQSIAKGINFLFGSAIRKQNLFIGNSLNYLGRKREIDKNYFDYIRLASLELVSNEINKNNLSGSVAELGVYKGRFARYINQYFPNRQFYLFDTFEGFDKRDVIKEKDQNYSGGDQSFSDTSIDAVIKLMPHPEYCKAIKGYFPESANDVHDEFVFVSLDADLYEPIHKGLRFFYPKLVKGGYIFVHDFNNASYKGARTAVEDFIKEQNINYVPIPDSGGSAIITK